MALRSSATPWLRHFSRIPRSWRSGFQFLITSFSKLVSKVYAAGVFTAGEAAEKLFPTREALPQRLKSLLKKSNSDVRPLKGHLISNDLRYR